MSGQTDDAAQPDEVLVRRSESGWQVAGEETADLTSAMVLADLLAADLGTPGQPPKPAPGPEPPLPAPRDSRGAARRPTRAESPLPASTADEAARLAVTVAQLEHALAARVRVEQAIGVLAERHRLRPRQAFDLLRSVARSGGRRVTDVSESVVDSATNPLLPLPEQLARRQAEPRKRGLSPRHARRAAS